MKSPTHTTNLWIDFWSSQTVFSPIAFEKCMDIFMQNSKDLFSFSPNDTILDIGSGPGALPLKICDKVKSVDCLDVSEMYLTSCRKLFADKKNVSFHKIDPTNYTNFSFLNGKKFSKIFCLSVIQYYLSLDEVIALIHEVQKHALPGAKFLIADIPVSESLLIEIFTHFYEGIKRGYLTEIIKMFFRVKTSSYPSLRKRQGVLFFNDRIIENLVQKAGVKAKILNRRLTVNGGRRHLLIEF